MTVSPAERPAFLALPETDVTVTPFLPCDKLRPRGLSMSTCVWILLLFGGRGCVCEKGRGGGEEERDGERCVFKK